MLISPRTAASFVGKARYFLDCSAFELEDFMASVHVNFKRTEPLMRVRRQRVYHESSSLHCSSVPSSKVAAAIDLIRDHSCPLAWKGKSTDLTHNSYTHALIKSERRTRKR